MSKVALFIAIAAMLGSAILGFLTKGKIQALEQSRQQASERLKTVEGDLTKSKTDLETAQAEMTAANTKAETALAEAQKATSDLDALNTAKASIDAELTAAKTLVADLQAKVAEGVGADAADPGTMPDTDLDALKAQLQEAQNRVAELQTVNTGLQSQMAPIQERADKLEAEEQRRANKVLQKGLEGQVLAVNQSWNFAVLSIGDRQGVVAGARMLVVRNGQPVATVKISSVEPSTSIADIVPGSVARGARVSPGDKVIFAGTEPVAGS